MEGSGRDYCGAEGAERAVVNAERLLDLKGSTTVASV